jgi:hypothetical protein
MSFEKKNRVRIIYVSGQKPQGLCLIKLLETQEKNVH